MANKLSLATLGNLGSKVAVPKYKRQSLSPGILHIGTGNFHRAHQGAYLDGLFNTGKGHDWAIVGTGVRDADKQMMEALKDQDYLTTLVEQEAATSRARITGVMIDFISPNDRSLLVKTLADPKTRIVSLTVTEGGYFIDPATGVFNPDDPQIKQDGANSNDPRTAFGLIALGLARRRASGIKPFTVMCCDNIPHNGVVTKNAVAGVARLSDRGLASWIEDNVAFPNAMVDRITPATTDRERKMLLQDYDIEDNWPVYCEEFIQWVLEDEFCNGRPALEEVGVQFVPDVTPFEFMKIRILNGGHATIAYPGRLLDVHFVHDAMNHPLIGGFFAKLEREEIMPTVPPVPGVVLDDYIQLIHRRFSNPKIGDTIARLAFDGSNRQPKFIVPVVRDQLSAGRSVNGLALESALWCRHCAGTSDSGKPTGPNDPIWDRLEKTAQQAKNNPAVWLGMQDIYGDTAQAPAFSGAFSRWLNALWAKGTETVLKDYLAG
ncbi:MAG: mannitol dehydrogenase family protein [Aestuariivirga sp.]